MIILSQRDPRWAETKLGSSNLTVGRYGCTTTCISMLSDYFKGFITPGELATQSELYTSGGFILWNKLNLPTMKFVWRFKGIDNRGMRSDSVVHPDLTPDFNGVRKALLDPDRAVILEVANGSHWVVALRAVGNSFIVADPWIGDKCDVMERYKNITGGAYFMRK